MQQPSLSLDLARRVRQWLTPPKKYATLQILLEPNDAPTTVSACKQVTSYVVWACIIAASGGALYGYDKGIAGGVSGMDPVLEKFYPSVYAQNHANTTGVDHNLYCNYNNFDLQWFSSSLWLAGAFFCVPAGYIARRWGRLRAMLIAGIAFLAGSILQAAAENVAMLISGRVLLGVGVAFAGVSVPLYNSEMVSHFELIYPTC